MDYSYIDDTQSQPFALYGLHSLPTPDPNQTPHATDDLRDAFTAALNYHNNANSDNPPPFGLEPTATASASSSWQIPPPPHSPPDSSESHNNYANANSNKVSLVESSLGRSSSEEKEGIISTDPNKRKAQNRAAQRAFRERKERHVKDLETKVGDLEETSTTLHGDNECLKRELARLATENEVLRATSRAFNSSDSPSTTRNDRGVSRHRDADPPTTTGPMTYRPLDLSTSSNDGTAANLHRVNVCPVTGEKLLDTGATWDLIQGHELFTKGLVDIEGVSRRLRSIAQCNGQGPAFRVEDVRRVILESADAAASRNGS